MPDQEPANRDSKRPNPPNAFLNIPYDDRFEGLYLAYIAGIAAYGLAPRATLEVPGGERRLARIFELIRSCRYSFHDPSRVVELDPRRPATPRFNMPFELGLMVAWDKLHPQEHTWFVFEAKERRLLKSLSDLAGTDVYIHDGQPRGLFSSYRMRSFGLNTRPQLSRWQLFAGASRPHFLLFGSGPGRDPPSRPECSRNLWSQRAH